MLRALPCWLAAALAAAPAQPDPTDIATARQRHREQAFHWAPWGPEAFARAKRENKPLLIDGAAEWCHWCHVMDETTYRDPELGRRLEKEFVAVRFDVDEHPDLEERYSAWGWPATILLSPEARELGKYRGYLTVEELTQALDAVGSAKALEEESGGIASRSAGVDSLDYLATTAAHTLDGYYDEALGGWGMRRKAPISEDAEFELRRAIHGDPRSLSRAVQSLVAQRALIDPVWSGIYQYSAAADWKSPHFEKLMTYQAAAIEAYARGFQASGDRSLRDDARGIAGYLEHFLRTPEGTFHPNQDADLGAHAPGQPFVDGASYYAKDDAGRRALGTPWIDGHVYARENGLAISALCALQQVDPDPKWLSLARAAADGILASHVAADGSVRHEADGKGVRTLADAASLGRGLACLAEVAHQPRYRAAAQRIAQAMNAHFRDAASGAFWSSTADPDAAGVFAARRHAFDANVEAARFLAALKDPESTRRARLALAAVATPAALEEQGLWLGQLLLALDDAGAIRWPKTVH